MTFQNKEFGLLGGRNKGGHPIFAVNCIFRAMAQFTSSRISLLNLEKTILLSSFPRSMSSLSQLLASVPVGPRGSV